MFKGWLEDRKNREVFDPGNVTRLVFTAHFVFREKFFVF
jgi:hypothetical protein